jgi:hypothetical protein
MNLQYTNLTYTSYEHVNEEFLLTFDLTVKDLDGGFLDGEEFVFTFVASDSPKYNTTEIAKQILADFKSGKISTDSIAEYEDPNPLGIMSLKKQEEIRNFKNELIDEICISYDDDVFDISDRSLARLASTIQSLLSQESGGNIDRKTYRHKWVSQMGVIHEFTIDQLIELNRLAIDEVQSIILRYNHLIYDVIPSIKDKRELHFLNWYSTPDESNNNNE